MEPDDTPVEDYFFLTLERGGRISRLALRNNPAGLGPELVAVLIEQLWLDLAKQEDPQ